jgi:hypothetical protein
MNLFHSLAKVYDLAAHIILTSDELLRFWSRHDVHTGRVMRVLNSLYVVDKFNQRF